MKRGSALKLIESRILHLATRIQERDATGDPSSYDRGEHAALAFVVERMLRLERELAHLKGGVDVGEGTDEPDLGRAKSSA